MSRGNIESLATLHPIVVSDEQRKKYPIPPDGLQLKKLQKIRRKKSQCRDTYGEKNKGGGKRTGGRYECSNFKRKL